MELVTPMRSVCFGEAMIEVCGAIGAPGQIGYGGDTLNVAVALARLGLPCAFFSALGLDAWSDAMLAAWQREGVDISMVARHPSRVPGLYAIRTDPDGERHFTYWRDSSAARALFGIAEVDALFAIAAQANLLFLSGITLSLYDAAARARIGELAATVRAHGGSVAFDPNYRPRGWPDAAAARAAFEDFARHVSLALPTASDEAMLYADEEAGAIAQRWHAMGAGEVVVKLGAQGAFVSSVQGSEHVPTQACRALDTTGAGDAFDAGYLAARLRGKAPAQAAAFGHQVAAETILHRGAIPPREAIARFAPLVGA